MGSHAPLLLDERAAMAAEVVLAVEKRKVALPAVPALEHGVFAFFSALGAQHLAGHLARLARRNVVGGNRGAAR